MEKGTQVRRKDNPGKIGTATGNQRPRNGTPYYSIRWHDGTTDYCSSELLEVLTEDVETDIYQQIESGQYGRAEDLRRNLTHVHLSGRLANLVYSMGVTNTDFYAHQYKPLLTLLESPASGILIADEVGLGKTIEAGIIWTELRAREEMRRLLIVCPAMLRDKWRDELLNRFGIESQMVDAATLTSELQNTTAFGPTKAWIASYQALRPPRGWKPGNTPASKKPGTRHLLADLLDSGADEEPLVDLVIFDEAHYMRNPDSASYKLGQMLQAVSHQRVLLSATPINTAREDLFHLLRLCDPDHFQFRSNFSDMIQANQPLVAARDAALRIGSTADEVNSFIQEAAGHEMLAKSRQLAALREVPPTDVDLADPAYRSELAASLERVNLLGHVITRTRKRDVQAKRAKRDPKAQIVTMTAEERAFYEHVTDVTRDYAYRNDISDGFLLATPQRQVCSCPAAFAKAWLGDQAELLDDMVSVYVEDSEELESADYEYEDVSGSLKDFLKANRPRNLDVQALERNDSKLNRLKTVLRDYFAEAPSEKVILFTSFRVTAKYLTEKLTAAGIPSLLIWGNMQESKQDLINQFRDQPDLRVLVSTEVASEGVDLQFSKLLINYDLPWNPMRVEQRIGRIDRLGQQADIIHIWNLMYADTIDERIFSRLLARLKIFEQALGEPEPIIGEVIQNLESTLLTRRLTPEEEERAIEAARQSLENVRIEQERLEKNAAQMMAHGGLVLERIKAAQEVSRRVTEDDLIIYVKDFLMRHAQGHQFVQSGDEYEYSIQLPSAVAADFDEYCRRTGQTGLSTLGNGLPRQCRFINKITVSGKRGWEAIHQFHPLVRFVGERSKRHTHHGLVSVELDAEHVPTLKPGDYALSIRKWSFSGVNEEEWLQKAACALGSADLLDEDSTETLINAARLHGRDWLAASSVLTAKVVADAHDLLDSNIQGAYQRALKRKQDENADRMMFQLHGLEQHLSQQLGKLESVMTMHRMLGRHGLVKATQGRIDKLCARIELKRERVRQRERLNPDDSPVCFGVIRVLGGKR